MWTQIKDFGRNQQGAISVDWMVISVSLIVLVGVIFAMLQTGTLRLAGNVETSLDQAQIVPLD